MTELLVDISKIRDRANQPTINGIKKLHNHNAVIGTTAYTCNVSQGDSASRLMMATVQDQQLLGPDKPEVPIFLSGGETEKAKYTFDDILPCNAYVVAKIPFYTSLSGSKDIPFTLVYREEETGVHDFIDVTPYIETHVKFTHRKYFTEHVKGLQEGDFIAKGTRLTRTKNIHEGDLHSNRVNALTLYISAPETTEDGFGITKEFGQKLTPTAAGSATISSGSTSYPVMCYGGGKRPYPMQGEKIREDGLISCVREYDEMWDWICTHESQLDKPDRIFDSCIHGEPGAEVYEVEALTNYGEGKRPVTNPKIFDSLQVYHNRKMFYGKRMLEMYTNICRNSNSKMSLALHRKFTECMLAAPNSQELISCLPKLEQEKLAQKAREGKAKKYIRTIKNTELDEWTVSIKYSWKYPLHKGAKLANDDG